MNKLRNRWYCRHCGTAGWSSNGGIPPHDRSIGGSCRASGQRSEREIRRSFTPSIPAVTSAYTSREQEAYAHGFKSGQTPRVLKINPPHYGDVKAAWYDGFEAGHEAKRLERIAAMNAAAG